MPKTKENTVEMTQAFTALATASENWGRSWPYSDLEWWIDYKLEAGKQAVKVISSGPACNGFRRHHDDITCMFGLESANPYHPLGLGKVQFGFTPTETQINKAMEYFLNGKDDASVSKKTRKKIVMGYLNALLPGEEFSELKDSFSAADGFEVHSEHAFLKKRRIDLLVAWPTLEECHGIVVVEVKFSHMVTTGQLSSYRNYARQKSGGQFALVLLSPTADHNLGNNKDWIQVSWFNLMLRMEKEFSNQGCSKEAGREHFLRLRNHIWNTIKV